MAHSPIFVAIAGPLSAAEAQFDAVWAALTAACTHPGMADPLQYYIRRMVAPAALFATNNDYIYEYAGQYYYCRRGDYNSYTFASSIRLRGDQLLDSSDAIISRVVRNPSTVYALRERTWDEISGLMSDTNAYVIWPRLEPGDADRIADLEADYPARVLPVPVPVPRQRGFWRRLFRRK